MNKLVWTHELILSMAWLEIFSCIEILRPRCFSGHRPSKFIWKLWICICSPLNPVGFRVYAIWGDVFEEPFHSLGIFVCWGRYTGLTLAKWAITITIGLLVGIELPSARREIWVQVIFVKVPVNSFPQYGCVSRWLSICIWTPNAAFAAETL